MLKTGQADSSLTKEEMLAEVAGDTCRLLPKGVECGDGKKHAPTTAPSEDDEELPWDSSEELLVVHQPSPVQRMAGTLSEFAPMNPVRDLLFWCALSSMMYGSCHVLKSTDGGKRLSLWAGVPLASTSKP